MADVRALIEKQSRFRRRRGRFHNGFAVLCLIAFVGLVLSDHAQGKPIGGEFRLLFPLLFVNVMGKVYTSRDLKALRDAIVDPDPALDRHFAEALSMQREEVASEGRRAFLERFSNRVPELDSAGWSSVAQGLSHASKVEAEKLLTLLAASAPFSAIEPIEAFANGTKSDRLRTLARQSLGEMRLRIARDRIMEYSESVVRAQHVERERLRL